MNKKYWISLDIHKVQEPLLKDLIQESYLRTL
ncbi:MmcQ/YjbR family DNA-binding protein [Enterococcus cecorum]